jgi:hypothetical protein
MKEKKKENLSSTVETSNCGLDHNGERKNSEQILSMPIGAMHNFDDSNSCASNADYPCSKNCGIKHTMFGCNESEASKNIQSESIATILVNSGVLEQLQVLRTPQPLLSNHTCSNPASNVSHTTSCHPPQLCGKHCIICVGRNQTARPGSAGTASESAAHLEEIRVAALYGSIRATDRPPPVRPDRRDGARRFEEAVCGAASHILAEKCVPEKHGKQSPAVQLAEETCTLEKYTPEEERTLDETTAKEKRTLEEHAAGGYCTLDSMNYTEEGLETRKGVPDPEDGSRDQYAGPAAAAAAAAAANDPFHHDWPHW